MAGHIVDDEMHRIMVRSLQPGVRLTAIFDSCHSGSALDLPYIYSTQGVLKEPNLAKEAGQGLLGIVSAYARGDVGSMASTAMGFFKKATTGDAAYERNKQTKTSPADVIMWSGSKDTQTSQDAQIAGQATGAMSWAFITALKKNPQQSYVQLLNSIRDELASKYTQKPQLSCSHPLSKLCWHGLSILVNLANYFHQIPTSSTLCNVLKNSSCCVVDNFGIKSMTGKFGGWNHKEDHGKRYFFWSTRWVHLLLLGVYVDSCLICHC